MNEDSTRRLTEVLDELGSEVLLMPFYMNAAQWFISEEMLGSLQLHRTFLDPIWLPLRWRI